MKKIVLIVVMVLFASLVYANDTDFTKTYEGRGVVTFNHTTHSSDPESCVGCHSVFDVDGVMTKDFGHKVCKTCHKSVGKKVAPTTCTGCHVK